MRTNVLALIALVMCLTVSEINSQLFSVGTCAQVPVNSKFNLTTYSGIWYEIARLPAFYETGLSCMSSKFSYVSASSASVVNSGYYKSAQKNVSTTGTISASSLSTPNYLSKTFPINLIFPSFNFIGPYNVWATDYLRYSVVYSCKEFTLGFGVLKYTFKSESGWILSRSRTLNRTYYSSATASLPFGGVNATLFQLSDQSNC